MSLVGRYIPVDFTTLRHSLIKLAGIERGQVESEILHSIITGLLLGGKYYRTMHDFIIYVRAKQRVVGSKSSLLTM